MNAPLNKSFHPTRAIVPLISVVSSDVAWVYRGAGG